MSFEFTTRNETRIKLYPSSNAEWIGTWISIISRKDADGVVTESPPCDLTPGELKLLRAGIDRRLEDIERDGE
jgi:hypothetical protein